MEKLIKDKTKQNIVRIAFMVAMVIFMVYPVISYTAPNQKLDKSVKLDGEWTVTINDSVHENVVLTDTVFQMCNKGDVVIYERALPNGTQVENPVLRFYSVHSAVQIFVDGRRIYSYGLPDYTAGNLLGYGDHIVPLPNVYAGKPLKIVLYVSEDNAFDGQSEILISNNKDYLQNDIATKRYALAISLFLIVFGIIIMCLSFLAFPPSADMMKMSKLPSRSLAKAIFLLSGDHTGVHSYEDWVVSCRAFPP